MKTEHALLVVATILAAAGQILFKFGATGRRDWSEFLNVPLVSGLICYGIGTILWIFALSKLPLKTVFPYTALTFVLVYVGAIFLVGERISSKSLAGVVCVLIGLFMLTSDKT